VDLLSQYWLDLLIIVTYISIIMTIGVRAGRKIKNSEDFFMGSRQFKKMYMIMYQFGSGTSADSAVSATSKIYTNGISGIWYLWMYLPITPFFWVIAPILRRMRALTIGDYFEARYDKSISLLYAAIGVVLQMVNLGVILKGSSELLEACTRVQTADGVLPLVPAEYGIILMTFLFLFYGLVGGLAAAVIADLIQGILTIAFSVLLIPFAFNAVGGMTGIKTALAGSPELLQLVAPSDISLFYIMMASFTLLVGIGTLPHHMGVCGAGRTELDGRVGFTYGSFLKRAATIAWAVVGLAAIVLFMGQENILPDQVFGLVANKFLTSGLMGLFIATFLSTIMSTCDNTMLSASALFTNNLYKAYFKTNETPKHYVNVGRVAAFFVVAGGIAIAYTLKGVIEGVELMWIIPSLLGISFWLGFIWRRMTVSGVWVATFTALIVWYITKWHAGWLDSLGIFGEGYFSTTNYNNIITKVVYMPWAIISYLSVGLVAGIVVSIVTKPVKKEKLDYFYGLMRTPVNEPEQLTEVARLPEGKTFAPERKLFNIKNIELQIPSRQAVIGFVLAIVVVSVLILSLLWILGEINWKEFSLYSVLSASFYVVVRILYWFAKMFKYHSN
jgi:Na+/proline symporter